MPMMATPIPAGTSATSTQNLNTYGIGPGKTINPATGKPYTQEEWDAAPRDHWGGLVDGFKSLGETLADVGTFGTYSLGKEALGGESSSAFADAASGASHAIGLQPILNDAAQQSGLRDLANGMGIGSPDPNAGGGAGGPVDISGIQGGAKDLFDKAMANYGRELKPTEIRDVAPINAPTVTARDVVASGPAATTGYSAAGPVGVERIAAPSLGPASQVSMPEELGAALAGQTGVWKTTLAGGPQDQIRALQTGGLAGLQELAEGKGPAAELEKARLDSAMARISDDALAAAGSLRGAGRGAGKLEAALQIAREGGKAALAGRENALQSQIAARGQVVQAAQGVRGQDIDFAAKAADLDQQANNLEAQLDAARKLGNSQEINRLTALQGQLRQQAKEANAQAINRRAEVQGEMTFKADDANAGRTFQSGTDYAGRQDKASEFGAGAANTSALDYGRRLDDAASRSADRDLGAQKATGEFSLDAQKTTGQQQLETDKARADTAQGAFQATTGAQAAAGGTANQALGTQNDALKTQVEATKASEADKAGDREFALEAGTAIATALGGPAAGYAANQAGKKKSDERAKQNIAEISPEALDGFAEAIARKIKTWEYKPGEGPPGVHVGPMAQDLEEAGPLGDALVHEMGGEKYIDQDSFANLMNLAAIRSKRVHR